jgi:hypothetical protein
MKELDDPYYQNEELYIPNEKLYIPNEINCES